MIKKIIKKLLRYTVPNVLHLNLAKKEEEKKILELKRNSKFDPWLEKNKNLHKGKRCFILATGPSLNKVDLSKIKNEYSIGVNGIYKLADEISLNYYIYVSDWYWKNHVDGIKNLNCDRKFLPVNIQENLISDFPTSWINVLLPSYYNKLKYPLLVPSFFSKEPEKFFTAGGSVIFLALQLAYHLGFSEVVILGLDHSYNKDDYKKKEHGGYYYDTSKGDTAHFDKDYNPSDVKYRVDLDAMENGYKMAKEMFDKDKRKVINASPGTMLDIFEKVDYDKYVNERE